MNLTEIRKLVGKLNKEERIVNVWKMKKSEILQALLDKSYQLDEEKRQLVPIGRPRKRRIK
tara:strand:- start:1318 stop:1500 length:183 start_codon:yes stop_codon:yes gene_type:complete